VTTQLECPCGPDNPVETTALYPPGTEPDSRVSSVAAACHYGVTQTVMTGALRHILGIHFSDPENIISASVRGRIEKDGVWQASGPSKGIIIESLHRWTPEFAEQRPAVILKENDWEWSRVAIGDRAGTDVRTGREYFSGLWTGSHTIFALANEAAEAQTIGWEVLNCLKMQQHEIAGQLNLQRFMPVSIGGVAAMQESSEHYLVPIVVGYVVPYSWSMQPEAPRLKRIQWRLSDVLADY